MFASIAGAYPRDPLPGLPDRLGDADRRRAAGELDDPGHAAVIAEVVAEVLLEQERAGLAVVADGGIDHDDRLLPLVEGLGGTGAEGRLALPDGDQVRAPRFDRPIAWTAPITVEAWLRADRSTDLPAKQVVIGPYTIARLAETQGAARERLGIALAEAMNAELHALARAGCPLIQIDEGAVIAIGDDAAEWRRYAQMQQRLMTGLEDAHLSLGLYPGAVHPAGYAALLEAPVRSYLVDLLGGPDAWRFAFAVPPERGIVGGIVDAGLDALDETEVMVWAMAWIAQGERGHERTGGAPNGSLRRVSRYRARRKMERLGEAIRIGTMGPLSEVAQALDPEPLTSRMPELRDLAAAVDAAR